ITLSFTACNANLSASKPMMTVALSSTLSTVIVGRTVVVSSSSSSGSNKMGRGTFRSYVARGTSERRRLENEPSEKAISTGHDAAEQTRVECVE
ncbi:hypothetical protein WUBG_01384, partial [Wuchereria bancrofti]